MVLLEVAAGVEEESYAAEEDMEDEDEVVHVGIASGTLLGAGGQEAEEEGEDEVTALCQDPVGQVDGQVDDAEDLQFVLDSLDQREQVGHEVRLAHRVRRLERQEYEHEQQADPEQV